MPGPRKILAQWRKITSKLTSKAQTAIPQPVRAASRLPEGDEIADVIAPGRVGLTRARRAAASLGFDGDARRVIAALRRNFEIMPG